MFLYVHWQSGRLVTWLNSFTSSLFRFLRTRSYFGSRVCGTLPRAAPLPRDLTQMLDQMFKLHVCILRYPLLQYKRLTVPSIYFLFFPYNGTTPHLILPGHFLATKLYFPGFLAMSDWAQVTGTYLGNALRQTICTFLFPLSPLLAGVWGWWLRLVSHF